jgi:hypothetical protein
MRQTAAAVLLGVILAACSTATPPVVDDLIVIEPLATKVTFIVPGRSQAVRELTESWIMTVQVCQGPQGYGDALRRGLIRGRLDCRWFFYTGIIDDDSPQIFESETECLEEDITIANPNWHFGDRKCHRVD